MCEKTGRSKSGNHFANVKKTTEETEREKKNKKTSMVPNLREREQVKQLDSVKDLVTKNVTKIQYLKSPV